MTIEGTTHLLARPFLVLATQNPIEYEGTYPLPEAQLDRFVLRAASATRAPTRSWRCSSGGSSGARTRSARAGRRPGDAAASSRRRRGRPRRRTSIGRYIVELVGATRASASAAVGASPRGSLAAAQALALPSRARRPRLRHAGRRQGGCSPGARAPARAQAGVVGAARRRPRTSSATSSTPCRRRRPRTSRPRRDPSRVAARRGVRGAGGPRAAGRAGPSPSRARGARRAVRGRAGARARDERPPELGLWLTLGRARDRGRRRRGELSTLNAAPSSGSRSCSRSRRAGDRRGPEPVSVRLGREEERTLELSSAASAGGLRARGRLPARARPARAVRLGGTRAGRTSCGSTPAPSGCST